MRRRFFIVLQIVLLTLLGSALGTTAGRLASPPTPLHSPPGLSAPSSLLAPVGSGFTYQGRLLDGGSPANGQYDFVFTLFDVPTGGSPVAGPITATNRTVTDGLTTVTLAFGAFAFQGDERYLEVAVQQTGGGGYTPLIPRQPVTPAPYALHAKEAESAPWLGVGGKPTGYNPLRLANNLTAPDISGNVGNYTSVTIGADGLPLVSYYDTINGDLKVLHCNDLACSSASTATLDSAGFVGQHSSITIGADKLGVISYYDGGTDDLNVAHCDNVECSSATISTVDSAGGVGQYTSITIVADGLPLISYYNFVNSDLKVAHCGNVLCNSGNNITTLDGAGVVGTASSIDVGADGRGLISYHDGANGDLKVAHCDDTDCTIATITTLDNTGLVGNYSSVALGADGLGLISYYDQTNGDLKVAHCANLACDSAGLFALDSIGNVGTDTSIIMGPHGLGLITYRDLTNQDLKVARCANHVCDSATTATLDSVGNVGGENSITVGVDGLPLISYYDQTNGDLKVLHCGSPLCVPYQHRR